MAKMFHVKHRKRARKLGGKLPREFRLKCQTCKVERPPDMVVGFFSAWDEPCSQKTVYCPDHAGRAGFCVSCGLFYAGVNRFDFGPGQYLCDNCWDEVQADSHWDEEEGDGWDEEEGDLHTGGISNFELAELRPIKQNGNGMVIIEAAEVWEKFWEDMETARQSREARRAELNKWAED